MDLRTPAVGNARFDRQEILRTDTDWLLCWATAQQFCAACGSGNHRKALVTFLE
ncbi:MAG: hypothetical protein H0W05_08065 [Thermoleophilaceae bacterium]|nr:hypothetical protein [Thermoleophilaceae bacterium]